MKNIRVVLLSATLLTAVAPTIGKAQTDPKSSSLKSLESNALLGGSFNDKDFGKLPTNITSDTLTLHAKERVFVYKGNVVVTQGDMTLTSREIEGNYNEQNQIQKIVAKGDVVITKQDIRATSQRAIYDAPTSIITLTDNPQLQQGESVLIADRIKVLLNENRSMAEGNVRVTFVKKDAEAVAQGTPAATPNSTPTPSTAAAKTPPKGESPQAKTKPSPAPASKSVAKKRP